MWTSPQLQSGTVRGGEGDMYLPGHVSPMIDAHDQIHEMSIEVHLSLLTPFT